MPDQRSIRRACHAGGIAVALLAAPASAVSVEIVGINSYYGFTPGDGSGTGSQAGGDRETLYVPSSAGGRPSELGINYTAYANAADSSFYFLHQDYCIGTCSTYSSTQISLKVTNDSDTATDFRFDSAITPGHMTLLGPNQGTFGKFDFSVEQSFADNSAILYKAGGDVGPDGIRLRGGTESFRGLSRTTLASGTEVVDWGATPLNLPLTIAPRSTSMLTYSATYYVRNTGLCDALQTCSSAEIVFGDPRNEGGVSPLGNARLSATAAAAVVEPWAGGAYDPFLVTFSVVDGDAPLPSAPPAKPQVTYVPVNRSNGGTSSVAVLPEPATWATMLTGMALVGMSLRRRRRGAGVRSAWFR